MLFVGSVLPLLVVANTKFDVDGLLADISKTLKTSPGKASVDLAKIKELETTLNTKQKEKYYLLSVASLTFNGKYSEQVALIQSVIGQIQDPESRVSFLYYLSHGYASLGEYENALFAMNDGIKLLPSLSALESKVDTLLAAVTLLNSLHAYDEAMLYADRIYALDAPIANNFARCIGLASKVEINFLKNESNLVRSLGLKAIQVCDANDTKIISLIVKSLVAIDLMNSDADQQGLSTGLSLLVEFSNANESSDYVTQLEESIARAYFKKGKLAEAEHYGALAYNRAKSQNVVQLMEKTSETMAAIKRKQGQSDLAMDYFEINLALKRKVLDDQLHKNLAYQRVKFDLQDKANELALSEQKNKTLTIEKALQQGKNQNLLLMITLSLILLAILGAWLIRTLRQKNIFQVSSQIDGLTQISNRSYFIESAKLALKNPANSVSLILFDMDHFKSINDTFGHSTGDWVLRTVCNTVKAQLRPSDLFGRLGGEEFALCLVNLSEPGVLALAERCRSGVAAIDTKSSGSQFLISASFGIATHGVRGNTSFEDILAAADKALYFSKNGGRNLVSVFQ